MEIVRRLGTSSVGPGHGLRRESGNRFGLRAVSVHGAGLNAEAKYSIAGCERAGEPLDVICRLRGTHEPEVLPMTIHEALRRYLARHPVIAPRRDGRARALDLPPAVFSQDEILLGGH